ncbi:MAG: hypothetical protein RLZZ501_2435 [Pseudomonadota bacterium]|jgi:hypothetical protein
MIASRLLAAAFLAASLAPVAALAQTASDDQPPAATQAKPDHAKPEHAKPDHAKPAHAKRDHAGTTQTAPAGEAAKTTPAGEAAKTTPTAPAATTGAPAN